jgi:NitT/TauT family transport system permease protein
MSSSEPSAVISVTGAGTRRSVSQWVPQWVPRWLDKVPQVAWRWTAAFAPPALVLLGLVALWAVLAAWSIIPRYLLPTPGALLHALITDTDLLFKRGAYTAQEAWTGLLLGNLTAVAAAIGFAFSAPLRRCLYPMALVSRAVPMIAIVPLLVIALGYGMTPIITMVAISTFFPTLLNMVRGLHSADVAYHELLHTLSASRLQRLRMVDLPAALPYLFAALKVGASGCFVGALVGEWAGANAGLGGLGYLIEMSSYHFRLDMLWAGVVVAVLLTLCTLAAITLAERIFTRWQPLDQRDLA